MYVFGSGRRWWRGGEWMRGLGLDFTNPVGTERVLDVCLCFGCGGVAVGGCRWGMGRGLGPASKKMECCYVCISCDSRFSV